MGVSTHGYIGVLTALLSVILGILIILTVIAAVVLWYRKKRLPIKIIKSYKDKKPKLKLDIKSVPRTKRSPPSSAYQILSGNQAPEFTIPCTPKSAMPGTPMSPFWTTTEPKDYFDHVSTPPTPRSRSPVTPISLNPGPSPPTTPETPGFILHSAPRGGILGGIFRRQSSTIPIEYIPKDRISERSPGALWRSTLGKTTASVCLMSPQRKTKRISFSPNGKIKYTIRHNSTTTELFVKILDIVDLPLTKAVGMSFPYVKVFLYPDCSDQFDPDALFEVLNFSRENTCDFGGLTLEQFRSSIIKFIVLDYDRFSRTEFVAECVVPLTNVNMDGEIESRHLEVRMDDPNQERGSLLVSLCYQPNTSQVSIIVLKAMGLPELEGGSHPDTFVKITLIRECVIRDKRRTKVAKKSIYPVFNEKLVFPVDEQGLRSVCLVFDIIRYESRLKQEKIGNVVIGNNYTQRGISPHELQHFHETLDNPQKQIAEWHKIIP